MEYQIIGSLILENMNTSLFTTEQGRNQIFISDECKLYQVNGEAVEPATLQQILDAQKIAVGNWHFTLTEKSPSAIIPDQLTQIN